MKFFKKLLPFVLSLLVVCSALPVTTSAATVSNFNFDVFDVTTSSNSYSGTITNSSSYPGYKACYLSSVSGTLRSFRIEDFDYDEEGYNFKLQKGDSIDLEFYCYPNSRYISFTPRMVLYTVDSAGHVMHLATKGTYDRSSGKISFHLENDSDFTETYLRFIEFENITLDGSHSNFSFYYKNISATSSSAQSGFMDSVKSSFSKLWEWLKNIIDSIKEIPTKIGESLTALGDSISGFFSNLINNISEWFSDLIDDLSSFFSDVGSWFTELADKIKGFFTNLSNNISGFFSNLWDNITGTVTDIRTAVQDWWQSVVDFFHSLFVPEEGYFDKYKSDWEDWARSHFGALYQAFEIVHLITEVFSLDGSSDDASIVIPEIRLPFLGKPVIMEQQTFSFSSIINPDNAMIYYGYQLFKIIVSIIFYSLLLNYLYKTFNSIFGVKEGDE